MLKKHQPGCGCPPCGGGAFVTCSTAVFPVPPAVDVLHIGLPIRDPLSGEISYTTYELTYSSGYYQRPPPNLSGVLYDNPIPAYGVAGFWRSSCEAVPGSVPEFPDTVTFALLPGPLLVMENWGHEEDSSGNCETYKDSTTQRAFPGDPTPLGSHTAEGSDIGGWVCRDVPDEGADPFGMGGNLAVSGCAGGYDLSAMSVLGFYYPDVYPPVYRVVIGNTVPLAGQTCVTVHTPNCPDEETEGGFLPGTPIEGATVELRQGATVIDSGTTDVAGLICLDFEYNGPYTVRVAVAGCPDPIDRAVLLGTCGSNPVGVSVCCGAVQVPVTDAMTEDPIEGASIFVAGAGSAFTDALGIATRAIPNSGMLGFGATPGDCSSRRVTINVEADNHLTRCVEVDVECGSTAEAPTVAPDPVELSPIAPDFVFWGACGPDDCSIPGYNGRAVVPACLASVVSVQYQSGATWIAPLGEDTSTWPPTGGTVLILTLDSGLLAGGTASHDNPLEVVGPALVYYWESTSYSWTPPGLTCLATYTRAQIWIPETGNGLLRLSCPELIVDPIACPDLHVPPDTVGCANCPDIDDDGNPIYSRNLDFDLGPVVGSFCARDLELDEDLVTLGTTATGYRTATRIVPAGCP